MSEILSAAVDLAGRTAGFALMRGEELLLARTRPMRGRDSAGLAPWIAEELGAFKLTVNDIARWSVGSGPGSFTGMRLAAALVAGWTFGKTGVKTRCIPTATAYAVRASAAEGEKIGCLFDGRNHELIYFGMIFRNGEPVSTGEEHVLNREQAGPFFAAAPAEHLVAPAGELPALGQLLEEAVLRRVLPVETADFTALIRAGFRSYDNNLTDLVYIRPAVFTTPQTGA